MWTSNYPTYTLPVAGMKGENHVMSSEAQIYEVKTMKQCEIEAVVPNLQGSFTRTDLKKICWLDRVNENMRGKIIDIKKLDGLWVINEIYDVDREVYEINRGWHVGGL